MHAEPLVTRGRDGPVHAPLEHRRRLITRQGFEGRLAIDKKLSLRPQPSPQIARFTYFDMKIAKIRSDQKGVMSVQRMNRTRDIKQGARDPETKQARLQGELAPFEGIVQLLRI